MIVNFRDHHVCFLYAWFSETLNKKAVLQWTCCCGQGDFQPSDYYVCTAPLRQLCANYSGILKKYIYAHTHTNICLLWEGFPDGSVGKESACNVGDPSSIPKSGRSTREGIGYPLQYSGLENFMDV